MLLGLAILLLMVCEQKISSICYPTTKSFHDLQPWLSQVVGNSTTEGCACCLSRTKHVTDCFLKVSNRRQQIAVFRLHGLYC